MKFLRKLLKPPFLPILSLAFLVTLSIAFAAIPVGSIDSIDKTARFYDDTVNIVNFKPSYVDPIGGSVSMKFINNEITGFAWGNNLGWINLNSINCDSNNDSALDDGNFDFCPTVGTVASFKVSYNPTSGKLSGFAWSENGGWINFGDATSGFLSGADQITINTLGEMNGFAWVENYGWLQFDCTGPADACVKVNFGGAGGGGSPQSNGRCGSSNGQQFSEIPVSGLCRSGSATEVTGDGSIDNPWAWQCSGTNGGFPSPTCTANFSAIAPPAPTTCEDITADNFGGKLPCLYMIVPPGGLCVEGVDCEPVTPILPPGGLCIVGFGCEGVSPVLPILDFPSGLCIPGFSCDVPAPILPLLPTLKPPTSLCVEGFDCEGASPILPSIKTPINLCIAGVNCPN